MNSSATAVNAASHHMAMCCTIHGSENKTGRRRMVVDPSLSVLTLIALAMCNEYQHIDIEIG